MKTNSWCPQCGPTVRVDEDGCCAGCGADAMGNGADAAIRALSASNLIDLYDLFVTKTWKPKKDESPEGQLTYSTLGVAGEAGEIAELVKKSLRTGGALDDVKLALELGDPVWYIVTMAHLRGISFRQVLEINMAKLYSRGLIGKNEEFEYDIARGILAQDETKSYVPGMIFAPSAE